MWRRSSLLLRFPRAIVPSRALARLSTTQVAPDRSTPTPAEMAQVLASDPAALQAVIAALPSDSKRQAGLQWAMAELESEFAKADKNRDGRLTYREFRTWAEQVIVTGPAASKEPPTPAQLRACFVTNCVPYVGFGMVDNAMMICSGEAIDQTLGLFLGLSTLGAAALGNAFSNGVGMVLHGTIERSALALGLPDPRLTLHQSSLPVVSNVRTAAGITGVLVGCILGMFPLLLMGSS